MFEGPQSLEADKKNMCQMLLGGVLNSEGVGSGTFVWRDFILTR